MNSDTPVGFAIGQPPTFWSPGNAMVVNHLIPSEINRFPPKLFSPLRQPCPRRGGALRLEESG